MLCIHFWPIWQVGRTRYQMTDPKATLVRIFRSIDPGRSDLLTQVRPPLSYQPLGPTSPSLGSKNKSLGTRQLFGPFFNIKQIHGTKKNHRIYWISDQSTKVFFYSLFWSNSYQKGSKHRFRPWHWSEIH